MTKLTKKKRNAFGNV